MIFVLLLLCGFFSVVTMSEQSPVGEVAARQVCGFVFEQLGKAPKILIVASEQPGDGVFAESLERSMKSGGAEVIGKVRGEPKDAREALEKIRQAGGKVEGIAATKVAGSWRVFSEMAVDFPGLGEPRLITPRSYRWPNFLKTENLLNIGHYLNIDF